MPSACSHIHDGDGQRVNGGWRGQAMRDIVAKCLVKDQSKRPTAAQLLEHKFFKVCVHHRHTFPQMLMLPCPDGLCSVAQLFG